MPLFRPRTLVGVDVGTSSVKAIELESAAPMPVVRHVRAVPLPPDAIVQGSVMNAPAVAGAVAEAVRGARSRVAATSISGHAVIVKRVRLPSMTPEELEEQIPWEAEQYIPFDVNEVTLDYEILSPGGPDGQMDVLLVAAKKELVEEVRGLFEEAGLRLAVLDVDAFAAANAYEATCGGLPETPVALVDVGAAAVNVTVLEHGAPVFTRDLATGGRHFTEEIQKALNLSFDDAEALKIGGRPGEVSREVVPQEVEDAIRGVAEMLAAEIQRSLDFYRATSGQEGVGRLVLCGGGARVAGLAKLLAERTGVETELFDPLAKVELRVRDAAALGDDGPAYAVALGLALRRPEEP